MFPSPDFPVEVDTATAAFLAGVPVHSIRNWASRGYLQPLRADGTKTLYDTAEVVRCAARFGHIPELRAEDRDCVARNCPNRAWTELRLLLCQSHALAIWLAVGDELQRRSHVDTPPPPRETQPLVYFIQAGDLIKIGTTTSLSGRLAALRTANGQHVELLLAVAGGRTEETQVHALFDEERLRGEWFRPSQRLLDFINDRRDQDIRTIHGPLVEPQSHP